MRTLCVLAFVALLTASLVPPSHADKKAEGWTKLFNGKNLDGWMQRNGTAKYRVEDGTVVGTTSKGSPNSFLCTKKDYGDFELVFEVKVDDPLNSGVQIRSKSKGGKPSGRVHGPQVEIATNGSAAHVWGEALGTGWLSDFKRHKHFKNGEWNQYKVRAVGNHITTWLNGEKIADFKDTKTDMDSGFIGLQVHSIPKNKGPYEVRWKDIYIKNLSKK